MLTGVYLPTIQHILGLLMFIRHAWIVGCAGILQSVCIVSVCCLAVSNLNRIIHILSRCHSSSSSAVYRPFLHANADPGTDFPRVTDSPIYMYHGLHNLCTRVFEQNFTPGAFPKGKLGSPVFSGSLAFCASAMQDRAARATTAYSILIQQTVSLSHSFKLLRSLARTSKY